MKKRILIYDDDSEILFLCKAILSKYNFEVETLSTCENIIADIEKIQPALVLMDLWIPVMGGEKAITLAKGNKNVTVPILIFSANADIKQISEKVKADGYIEKPFIISNFIKTIRTHTGE